MLDEINEQTDQMQQIQDAMAQPIGPAADMDEDELMGELEVRLPDFFHQFLMRLPCPEHADPAIEGGATRKESRMMQEELLMCSSNLKCWPAVGCRVFETGFADASEHVFQHLTVPATCEHDCF